MPENQGEHTYSLGNGVTLDEVKQLFEAKMQQAVNEAMARGVPEEAEPAGWWNLWAFGPVQPIRPGGPLLPHKIIKVGEPAYIFTVLWLNPWMTLDGGPTVCDLVSNLACDFEVKYCTGNKCTWNLGPPGLNVTHKVKVEPGRCWYFDVLEFVPQADWEGCFQTHICARITGCPEDAAPALAGFATAVFDIDADMFYPLPAGWTPRPGVPPRWQFDIPIQFMIYS